MRDETTYQEVQCIDCDRVWVPGSLACPTCGHHNCVPSRPDGSVWTGLTDLDRIDLKFRLAR